jgi:hypothetical protein
MSFILSDYMMDGGSVRKFTPVGGYPLYYLSKDGVVLSSEAVEENIDLCRDPNDSGWFIVAAGINWENPCLYCDHTGNRIESAYAENEEVAS